MCLAFLRRLTVFYKISKGLAPSYLSDHIPKRNEISMVLRNRCGYVPLSRTDRCENSFFHTQLNLGKILMRKQNLNPLFRALKRILRRTTFEPLGTLSLEFLTNTGYVSFSDLRGHRFSHNFNYVSPVCDCGLGDETTVYYMLRCPLFTFERIPFLDRISDLIHPDVTVLPGEHLLNILLYGSNVYKSITNKLIIGEAISFIRNSGRFIHFDKCFLPTFVNALHCVIYLYIYDIS